MTQTHTHHPATFTELLASAQGNTCEGCGKSITEGVLFCFGCGTAYQDAYYTPSCPKGYGQEDMCEPDCPRICVCPNVG